MRMAAWLFLSVPVLTSLSDSASLSVSLKICSAHIGTNWRQWKSLLGSSSVCYSSNIDTCSFLDNIVLSSSTGHLQGGSLLSLPTQGTISILSMWLQSISFRNRFLLLFPQACKSNFTQHQNLCSIKNAGIECREKIALLLNMVCVNRTPLSFYFESKHLSKFICSLGKAGVS